MVCPVCCSSYCSAALFVLPHVVINQLLARLFQRVNQLVIHSSESILHEQAKCSSGVVSVLVRSGGCHVMMIGAAADPLTHVLFVEYASVHLSIVTHLIGSGNSLE